jgi:hypothetical protein
LGAKSFTFVP